MTMQQPGANGAPTTTNTNETAAHAPAAAAPPPAPPPPPAAAPAPAGDDGAPPWLPARLQREREAAQREVLSQLGVPDLATARQQIQAATAAATTTARAATLEQTVKQRADYELGFLTDAQRSAVKTLAGDDPARVLTVIDSLRPTWGAPSASATPPAPQQVGVPATTAPAAPPAAAPAAAPPPAAAPAADTAPGRTAPGGTPAPTAPTHTSVYAALLKSNPFAAAEYGRRHGAAIAEGK